MSSNFRVRVLNTLTCQTFLLKILPKLTVKDKPIVLFEGISSKNERVQIHHEKYKNLAKSFLSFNYMFDNHLKKNDLIYVICENCSMLNGKTTRSIFGKGQIIQKPHVVLIIVFQRTMYNFETQMLTKNYSIIALTY